MTKIHFIAIACALALLDNGIYASNSDIQHNIISNNEQNVQQMNIIDKIKTARNIITRNINNNECPSTLYGDMCILKGSLDFF